MERRRPSASAMRIPTRGPPLDRPPSTSRSSSHTSITSSHSRDPMAIPGAPIDEPPPPLPPPRYNEELDRGIDVAWTWQNSELFGGKSKLAPIKPSSSLYGGYLQARSNTRRSPDDDMEVDDWDRRGSTVSTLRSPSQADINVGAGGTAASIPSLIRRPPSPTPSNQRLHGERPLAQENFSRSSQAYDQRVLSKIGKPNSPPRHLHSDSAEGTPLAQKLSLQTRNPKNNQRLAVIDLPSASVDPVSRWVTSPISGSASPGVRQGWRDYMDHRSPSNDSTAASLVLDPELFLQSRSSGKPSTTGSNPGNDDSASQTSHSQRGSYDQAMYTDLGHGFPGEESGGFRNLNLSTSRHQVERKASQQGMKRRALSPPAEMARDDKSNAYPAELFQKMSGSNPARSPAAQYRSHPAYGSMSSTASSIRQNSYASSFAPSLAGSSLTSISSYERQSPSDPSQIPFITSAHPVSSPATSIAPSRKQTAQQSPQDTKSILRKMSIQTAVNDTRPPTASRIGSYYMCDCCPKKPKKFDTEDELRAHQMEKQYSCQYCNNRFKNKNEAERHQNSLHLRRHSWSCAAIPSYHSAFHPATAATSQGPAIVLSDACGFCGEEFPNHPQPDWDRRIDHLTNVHKFGECNQAKKFFRADHFRQHLKHSHAGQSGKWTNMLESVCLREEQSSDVTGVSPTESDSGQDRGFPGSTDVRMGSGTINEAQEEP